MMYVKLLFSCLALRPEVKGQVVENKYVHKVIEIRTARIVKVELEPTRIDWNIRFSHHLQSSILTFGVFCYKKLVSTLHHRAKYISGPEVREDEKGL